MAEYRWIDHGFGSRGPQAVRVDEEHRERVEMRRRGLSARQRRRLVRARRREVRGD